MLSSWFGPNTHAHGHGDQTNEQDKEKGNERERRKERERDKDRADHSHGHGHAHSKQPDSKSESESGSGQVGAVALDTDSYRRYPEKTQSREKVPLSFHNLVFNVVILIVVGPKMQRAVEMEQENQRREKLDLQTEVPLSCVVCI